VAAVTVTNNFLIAVTTSVATRNNTIRYLKHDDEVEEVYKIAKFAPYRGLQPVKVKSNDKGSHENKNISNSAIFSGHPVGRELSLVT